MLWNYGAYCSDIYLTSGLTQFKHIDLQLCKCNQSHIISCLGYKERLLWTVRKIHKEDLWPPPNICADKNLLYQNRTRKAKGRKYEDCGKWEGSKTQICPFFAATLVRIQQYMGLAAKEQGNKMKGWVM